MYRRVNIMRITTISIVVMFNTLTCTMYIQNVIFSTIIFYCMNILVQTVRLKKVIVKAPGLEVIFFSCSAQLRMKFSLLINMKMPTIFSCSAMFS